MALVQDVSPNVDDLSTIDESALYQPSTSKAPSKGKRIMIKKEKVEEPIEKATTKPKYAYIYSEFLVA